MKMRETKSITYLGVTIDSKLIDHITYKIKLPRELVLFGKLENC